jgi:hypothetical protein
MIVALIVSTFVLVRSSSKKSPTTTYNPQAKTSGAPSKGQSGGVIDNNGPAPSSSASPGSSPSTTPAPGAITVTSPAAGSKVANGTVISGAAPGSSTVSYRIKDSVAGVLTTGQLSINSASQFSGTVANLQPSGTSGYVEVYNVNPSTGVESGNVKVAITF